MLCFGGPKHTPFDGRSLSEVLGKISPVATDIRNQLNVDNKCLGASAALVDIVNEVASSLEMSNVLTTSR